MLRFRHRVDPSELESIDEWALWLEAILHNDCAIFVRDDEDLLIETKQLVGRLAKLALMFSSAPIRVSEAAQATSQRILLRRCAHLQQAAVPEPDCLGCLV